MKAVILETKNGYAAALKDDGTVVKIKDENYKVGDVIRMKEKKPLFNKKWGTLVAALLIFAMVGTGTWAYAEPFYFVGFEDDDKQITFEVNRFDRIIDVDYNDEELEESIGEIDLMGMKIDAAVVLLMEELELGYEDDFYITTAEQKSDDREDAERLADKIRDKLEENALEVEEDDDVEDEDKEKVEAIGFAMVEEAREYSIAPGKLNIINKLTPTDDDEIVFGEEDYDREDLIEIAKENPKELMKIFSDSKGNKNGVKFQDEESLPPGQQKKVEEENRNTERNTEENQEMNGNIPETNPGNKGGNGKGNGN